MAASNPGGGTGSSVWRNFMHLATGRALSAVFSLLATAIMARALGPAEFGLVVLLHTYVLTIRSLVNLRPAETFVRFGVPLMSREQHGDLAHLAGLVRSWEVVTMLGGTAIGLVGAPLLGVLLGWQQETIAVAAAYSLVLLFSGVGLARSVCRALERFDVLRNAQAVGPILRLTGVLIAWGLGASWHGYALAWGLSLAAMYQYLGFRGRRLRREANIEVRPQPWRTAGERFPGIGRFVGVAYLQGNLDLFPRQGLVLVVGALLGTTSAGLFRIAREVADLLAKPVQLIRQAAFTEIAREGATESPRLWRFFKRYGLRFGLPALGLILLIGVFRAEILTLIGGPAYAAAGTLLVLLLVAAGIELIGAVLRPIAYAGGREVSALVVQLGSMSLYLACSAAFAASLGIEAVGLGAVAAALLTVSALAVVVRRAR
ncbi:MAG: oligosaccharide flippase family protein [Pseudomonadota bacterium]